MTASLLKLALLSTLSQLGFSSYGVTLKTDAVLTGNIGHSGENVACK